MTRPDFPEYRSIDGGNVASEPLDPHDDSEPIDGLPRNVKLAIGICIVCVVLMVGMHFSK